jgi:hemin uptake protein HemP
MSLTSPPTPRSPRPALPGPARSPVPTPGAAQRRFDSVDLFGDAVEVEIEHQSQVYRLRRTSLGKLILTK